MDIGLIDIEALLAHCRAALSAYKVPHVVKFIAEIPRTGSGKITHPPGSPSSGSSKPPSLSRSSSRTAISCPTT